MSKYKEGLFFIIGLLLFAAFMYLANTIYADIGDFVSGRFVPPSNSMMTAQMKASDELMKLIAHFAFVAFILASSITLFFIVKKGADYLKTVSFPLLFASALMFFRFLVDTGDYLVRKYEKAGLYIVIIGSIIVLVSIVIIIQKRISETVS